MGSDESHFNVSVGSDGQSHMTMSPDHNFLRERRAEAVSNRGPSAYQLNALPLGQTGSPSNWSVACFFFFYRGYRVTYTETINPSETISFDSLCTDDVLFLLPSS